MISSIHPRTTSTRKVSFSTTISASSSSTGRAPGFVQTLHWTQSDTTSSATLLKTASATLLDKSSVCHTCMRGGSIWTGSKITLIISTPVSSPAPKKLISSKRTCRKLLAISLHQLTWTNRKNNKLRKRRNKSPEWKRPTVQLFAWTCVSTSTTFMAQTVSSKTV